MLIISTINNAKNNIYELLFQVMSSSCIGTDTVINYSIFQSNIHHITHNFSFQYMIVKLHLIVLIQTMSAGVYGKWSEQYNIHTNHTFNTHSLHSQSIVLITNCIFSVNCIDYHLYLTGIIDHGMGRSTIIHIIHMFSFPLMQRVSANRLLTSTI